MKNFPWTTLIISALVFALAGCSPATAATPLPTLAPVATVASKVDNVHASAKVVPAQEADLSFLISGQVTEVNVEKGDQVKAGQVLLTLNSPELEYGVLQAKAGERAAELDYEYWKLPRRVGGEVVERGPVAEQELAVARRSLEMAQAELSQTNLVAPFSATVVSVEAQPGEYVQPGQVVVTLAVLDALKVETTDLSERSVAAVKIGQPVIVQVDALDQEFTGTVSAVSPIADTLGSDVVFKVTIALDEQPLNLLWGMSADVEIKTE